MAGKALEDLLRSFVSLADMDGSSLPAKAVPFRSAVLSTFLQADPSDTFGLVGAFLSPTDFATFQELPPGQAAEVFVPCAHPGDLDPAATAVDLFIHKDKLERHKTEVSTLSALQHCLHASLPTHMRSAFISPATGVVKFGKPAEQWAKIMQLVGPLTPEHIVQEAIALQAPYRSGTPLLEFFEVHDRGHRFRATIGMPYSAYDAMMLTYTALESSGLFTTTLRQYRITYPNMNPDQTYERLKTLMLVQGEMDISAHKSTLSSAHAVSNFSQQLATLQATVANLERERDLALKSAKSAAVQAKPSSGPDRVFNHFCWSCGRQTNHPSHKCPHPAPGHQPKAVRRDTMGSAHV